MSDDLATYLASEMGLDRKPPVRAGLSAAVEAFLGRHLHRRTAVQQQAIEVIYDGADVLITSATASGKTEAAMVPIAARLYSDKEPSLAVYIAPTRALLNDLHKRLEAPLHQLGLEARLRHGDRQLPKSTAGLRVLFTTPESLDVLLARNDTLLTRTRYAVLDEVHQIFGTPRGAQLAYLLERLEHFAEGRIQRIALSATVGDPAAVAAWISPKCYARTIEVPGGRSIAASLRWCSGPRTVRRVVERSAHDKILCFVNSRRRSEDVYLALRDIPGLQAYVHYSSLTREQREFVERGFKAAKMAVCVATTTLELGIDIGSIQDVILVDPPTTVSSFLQRIGRGGRRGQTTCVTMTPRSSLEVLQFAAMLAAGESSTVEESTAGRPYSVLVQQIFSLLASKRWLCVHPSELPELFEAFPWLTAAKVDVILDRLVDQGFLRRLPGEQVYRADTKLESLLDRKAFHTNISGQDAGTPTFCSGRILAYLPLRPNQMRHGNVVLFAGRFWRITGISDRGLTVEMTEPVSNPVRPVWGSRGVFAGSSLLAQSMRKVLLGASDLSGHDLDARCASNLEALRDGAPLQTMASDTVWYEKVGGNHVYYTFAGPTENQLLRLLFEQMGARCSAPRGTEAIALVAPEPLDFTGLPNDPAAVQESAAANWRRFTSWVGTGPYFELLPVELRRAEMTAQVATTAVTSHVVGLAGADIVPAELGLAR